MYYVNFRALITLLTNLSNTVSFNTNSVLGTIHTDGKNTVKIKGIILSWIKPLYQAQPDSLFDKKDLFLEDVFLEVRSTQ